MSFAVAADAGYTSQDQPYDWFQQAVVPTVGGRLRTLAVDPTDSERLFAGTAEGTVIRSLDGGDTWQEMSLEPFVIVPRATSGPSPSDPRTLLPLPSGLSSLRAGQIEQVTNPVRRIAVCPGSSFEILVAARSSLFGSVDGGLTYLRLLGAFANTQVFTVDCRPECPEFVAVGTAQGIFISSDGGNTFSNERTPVGKSVQTVEISCEAGRARALYFAQGRRVYFVPLDREVPALEIFPSKSLRGELSGPFTDVLDLEVVGNQLWAGTEAGLFRSDNLGGDWVAAGDAFLQRVVRQIVAYQAPGWEKAELVALIDTAPDRNDVSASILSLVLTSSDGGFEWQTAFSSLSQRRNRWIQPGRSRDGRFAWWLATSGGIWVGIRGAEKTPDRALERYWARERLRAFPSLQQVVNAALEENSLTPQFISGLAASRSQRCYAPVVGLAYVDRSDTQLVTNDLAGVPRVFVRGDRFNQPLNEFAAFLRWDLSCLLGDGYLASEDRVDLTALRQEVSFAVQDAYRERMILLRRLSQGVTPDYVALTLRARVEALEALMEGFIGRPVTELPTSPYLSPYLEPERNTP
ncbi:MAG: hypothetical protein AAFU77_15040 [Myxococcota bacterium]